MKKGEIVLGVVILSLVLIVPFISAGLFSDTWNKITGKASAQNVTLNISVTNSPPWIYSITGLTAITLTDAPSPTYVTINFSVNDSDGASNLNNATAMINLTRGGEALRSDSLCDVKDFSGNYSNYTCNITLWWFDGAGPWTVYANISDLNGNTAINGTQSITVNSLTGFVMSPPTLNFTNLVAGSYNNTPTNHLLLNNTGNVDIASGDVRVNTTDLVGESTGNRFLFAGNFSMSTFTGGNIECNITASASQMQNRTAVGVVSSVLSAGNYTIGDGTAQEHIYACLRQVGTELTQQQYSTARFGPWVVSVV